MSKLGIVEDTLFIPMLGRLYASEHCPRILYDQKALELKEKLPFGLLKQDSQSQYTLLASAVRSANMDRFIRAFLDRRPNGVIVQLGCGLETAYYRCDNGKTRWYAVDLPHVVKYRRELLPEPEREMPLLKTGSSRSAPMCRTLLFWSSPAVCSTILRKARLWASCGCSRGLERLKSSLTP